MTILELCYLLVLKSKETIIIVLLFQIIFSEEFTDTIVNFEKCSGKWNAIQGKQRQAANFDFLMHLLSISSSFRWIVALND
jgi:hypothetical protein